MKIRDLDPFPASHPLRVLCSEHYRSAGLVNISMIYSLLKSHPVQTANYQSKHARLPGADGTV